MALIKLGDRGAQVLQLQQDFNARPSRLLALKVDGVFGAKTQARVMEFQRDNGLKADGIVGDITLGRLRGGGGGVQPPVNLAALMNQLAQSLRPNERTTFLSLAQPLAADRTLLANTATLEFVIILFILLVFSALLINSSNKANQEAGRDLARRVNNLRERLRSDPSQATAVTAEALQEAKKRARDLANEAQKQRESCFDKFTPDQFASKSRACAKEIAAVTTAIQSLLQKINTPTGGGITPESLMKGINASVAALLAALRALGTCMGCDNLFF